MFIGRAVTKALIGGGGGAYSYICVLPDEFLLKSTVMTTDFKRNSSDRTRIYEYSPLPPPPFDALVTVLFIGCSSCYNLHVRNVKTTYQFIFKVPILPDFTDSNRAQKVNN